ncbi:MAG: threonylcarbamoyl-AMP synthase [Nitrospiraceae bacterium]|nr:threonylcarbamoyl-AMP synthase [Nitrospiraceae bacterium]
MRIVPPTPEGVEVAARAIRAGEVVAYPTETVYGLAVDPFSEDALHRLFSAKERPAFNPVLLIVADLGQLSQVVLEVSPRARAYVEAFWPGPLSMLFPKSPSLPDALTADSSKVCVRQPACAIARDLCLAFGGPITSSSANASGGVPASSPHDIALPMVSVCIDGGALGSSPPSTVFDPDLGIVLRAGAISEDALLGVGELGPRE